MPALRSLVGRFALLLILSVAIATPARANEMAMDGCAHDATIESLRTCVLHATEHAHIDSAGVSQALLAKLDAAAKALSRGHNAQAIHLLSAFVAQIDAQTGRHIHAEHSTHLRSHAEAVIAALGN